MSDEFDDAGAAPVGGHFAAALDRVRTTAAAAVIENRKREEREAQEAAEEAARQAELDAAARARPLERLDDGPPNPAGEVGHEEADNVVPIRKKRVPKGDGRGDFFAIDHRIWDKVCSLGLNPAVAYLVLARGTGGDNRTTSWSVNAIEDYTGIGRPRAKTAIAALETNGLVRVEKRGTSPQYYLVPTHEITGGALKPALSDDEASVLADFQRSPGVALAAPKRLSRYNENWSVNNPNKVATALAQKGYLQALGGYHFKLVDASTETATIDDKPDWTWLPNAIVDGPAREPSPLEKIRQSQNLAALRIFIELYHAHDLADEGGIRWRKPTGLRQEFSREKIAERGPYVVWGFKSKNTQTWIGQPWIKPHYDASKPEGERGKIFWDGLAVLTQTKLIEAVPHLVESDEAEDAEIIHPLPYHWSQCGEEGEREIAAAARHAATQMATQGQVDWAAEQGLHLRAPVFAHVKDVAVVGIYRMQYRPRTTKTRLWYAASSEWPEWVARYQAMAAEASGQKDATSR